MKQTWVVLLVIAFAAGCNKPKPITTVPSQRSIIFLPHTPIKNQGCMEASWIYATLSLIESDRLNLGDSVNLSAKYVLRQMLQNAYLSSCTNHKAINFNGTGFSVLKALDCYGVINYDAYPDTLMPQSRNLIENLNRGQQKYKSLPMLTALLDKSLGYPPLKAFLYGYTYNPVDLAHSVTLPGDYVGFMSDARYTFGTYPVLPIAENIEKQSFANISIQQLVDTLNRTLETGHTMMWQGYVPNCKFFLSHPKLDWRVTLRPINQRERQRALESCQTGILYALHIVGKTIMKNGRETYYICKNSCGTKCGLKGYFFLSENYLRIKTIALIKHR